MKTVGLLGGTAYPSTALYYTKINQLVKQSLGGHNSAQLILWSFNHAPLAAATLNGDFSVVQKEFASAAKKLESIGAEGIVICANIMHCAAPDINAAVGIPVLHIVDAIGSRMNKERFQKIGILATRPVCDADFYVPLLEKNYGLDVLMPDEEGKTEVHKIIHDEIGKGIMNKKSGDACATIMRNLVERGVECIVLACTDLAPLLEGYDIGVEIFDSTIVHAEYIAEWALSGDAN